jgi:hypothetical protein
MTESPLVTLQHLLARINDVPVTRSVSDYLIDDAYHCSRLLGRTLASAEDEQVLISESEAGAALSVYIDSAVSARLQQRNPAHNLSDDNLDDFCTAVEGVSHFQYLVWCLENARQVSLLELELQAEVDKYAAATCLLMQQAQGFHPGLHQRLFSQIEFLPTLDAPTRQRYREANRCAAHFCRRNDERYLNCRQPKPERWLGALQELFRCSHHGKVRRALC